MANRNNATHAPDNQSIEFIDYWHFTRLFLLTILVTVFCGLTVLNMDQVRDIFVDFEQERVVSFKSFVLFVSVIVWSFSLYSTTLMIIYLIDLKISAEKILSNRILQKIIFKLPFFLSSMPFLFMSFSFYQARANAQTYFYSALFLFTLYKVYLASPDEYISGVTTAKEVEEETAGDKNDKQDAKKGGTIGDENNLKEELKAVWKHRNKLFRYFFYQNIKVIISLLERIRVFRGIVEVADKGRVENRRFRLNILLVMLVSFAILIFFIVCCIRPLNVSVTPFISPLPLIITAFSMYTIIAMLFSILNFQMQFPAVIVTLFVIYVSAGFNNNHELRSFGPEGYNSVQDRLSDTSYVRNWVAGLISEYKKADSTDKLTVITPAMAAAAAKPAGSAEKGAGNSGVKKVKVLPIYLIAAEGGGIRATYWTANVLVRLGALNTSFNRRTLCLSGVSGGSIGIGIYRTYLQRCADITGMLQLAKGKYDQEVANKVMLTTQKDFLSPLVGAFLFGDAFQRTIPFKIPYLDRARLLESAITHNYEEVSKDTVDRMNQPFLKHTRINDFLSPIVLFNSTLVESGQKAIFSNVRLTRAAENDVFDILSETNTDYPYVTAAVTSARFPFITPPGKINVLNRNGLGGLEGHLVDGGYIDNTGIQSALMLLQILHSELRAMSQNSRDNKIAGAVKGPEKPVADSTGWKKGFYFKLNDREDTKFEVRPVLIFIKNGDRSIKKTKPIGWKYEASPIFAFYNAYDRKTIPMEYTLSALTRSICPSADVVEIALNRNTNTNLPLSWYLSQKALSNLKDQIKTYVVEEKFYIDKKW